MKLKNTFLLFITLIFLLNIFTCNYSYGAELTANSPAVILIDSNTGKIMYEKNAYQTMYPASTTKIMTAILVIENCNLSGTTTISANALKLPSGYVGSSLQLDEEITIKDLLYLLLLVSANDGAIALAEHVAGSVDNFATMMNTKASEIGCLNTHFVNPNGIHNENHYTTAYDLALIAKYAMKNDTFREIVSTTSYTTSPTNKYDERTLYNTNLLLHQIYPKSEEENIYYSEYSTGIKTGYTKEAKNCLVASAKKDNVEYISVVLGSAESENNYSSQRYDDAKNLFLTVFDNYTLHTFKKSGDVATTIEIPNGDFIRRNLKLLLENDIEILMNNKDISTDITPEVTLNSDSISAPISKGEILGTVTYMYDGIPYTSNIVAATSVSTTEQMQQYFQIALIALIILITFTVFEILRKK